MQRSGAATPQSVQSSLDKSFCREFEEFESKVLRLGLGRQLDSSTDPSTYQSPVATGNRSGNDSDCAASFNGPKAAAESCEHMTNFSDVDRDSLGTENDDDADYSPSEYEYTKTAASAENSIEVVNPKRLLPSALENPIETYDSVVNQMVADGIDWVPPDQRNLKPTEVRWAPPEPITPKAAEASTPNSRFSSSPVGKSRCSPIPTEQKSESNLPFQRMPVTGDARGNSAKLQELQSLLSQEQATRKQQDDYIQQLQRYYDNLLAKHAAAEITIDHLRLQAKVGEMGDQSSTTLAPSAGTTPRRRGIPNAINTTMTSPALKDRRLISASLDTCAVNNTFGGGGAKRKNPVGGSLLAFSSVPEERQDWSNHRDSNNLNMRSEAMQPQVHLMPISSSANNLSPTNYPTRRPPPINNAVPPKPSHPGYLCRNFGADDISIIGNDDMDCHEGERRRPVGQVSTVPSTSDHPPEQITQFIELQLKTSLQAIHDRLEAIEAYSSLNSATGAGADEERCREALMDLQRDLEDIRRRHQAGMLMLPRGSNFDIDASIAQGVDRMAEAVERSMAGQPARPSSLGVANRNGLGSTAVGETSRPGSAASKASASSNASSSASSLQSHATSASLISTASMNLNTTATSSLEAAETHFVRLLARYNKLKATPGAAKDLESLMQRMLQLSQRYSSQSSIIFPPKSLRQMFETDYGGPSFGGGCGGAKPNEGTSSLPAISQQYAAQSTDNGTSHRSMKVFTLTPDSGVPPTPSAGSSSSGGSGGVVRGSGREEGCLGRGHGGLVRQQTAGSCDKPVTYFPLGPNNTASAVIDNNRKQSDSGICATEDSSALPYARHNPRISRSTTTEDVFVDNQGPRNTATPILLPGDVEALESNIQQLREGIERLSMKGRNINSLGRQSLHYRNSGTASASTVDTSTSSSSACNLRNGGRGGNCDYHVEQKRSFHPMTNPPISKRHSNQQRRTGRSSSTVRAARIPDSSSSSDDENVHLNPSMYTSNHHNSRRVPSRSRPAITDDISLPLEVIGHRMVPQTPRGQWTPGAGALTPTTTTIRTYTHRQKGWPSRDDGILAENRGGSTMPRVLPHRRSRSVATGNRDGGGFPAACGSCGGSGLYLNAIDAPCDDDGYGGDVAVASNHLVPPSHSHTTSHRPTVRLPVRQPDNAWTERAYGMRELYGSAVSPQTGRAYNTIGHQPSGSPHHLSACTRSYRPTAGNPLHQQHLLPSVSSPQIAPRIPSQHRRHQLSRYEAAPYDDGDDYDDDVDTNSYGEYNHEAATSRPWRGGKSYNRHRGSEDAYATARTVTEMAQRLNTRLARQSSDSYHQGAVGGAEAVNRRRPSRHSSLYQ